MNPDYQPGSPGYALLCEPSTTIEEFAERFHFSLEFADIIMSQILGPIEREMYEAERRDEESSRMRLGR